MVTWADGGIIPAGTPLLKFDLGCVFPGYLELMFATSTKNLCTEPPEKCNDACIIEGCDHCVFEKEEE